MQVKDYYKGQKNCHGRNKSKRMRRKYEIKRLDTVIYLKQVISMKEESIKVKTIIKIVGDKYKETFSYEKEMNLINDSKYVLNRILKERKDIGQNKEYY